MAVGNAVWVIPQMLILMLGILWALAVTYMYPMMVTYQMNFRTIIRNSFILAVGRLPGSVGIRLLHCVPTALFTVIFLLTLQPWVLLLLFAYYLVFGFAFSRFITASFTNAVFDKYINSRIEGAQVNRGLSQENDDDDDDDEHEHHHEHGEHCCHHDHDEHDHDHDDDDDHDEHHHEHGEHCCCGHHHHHHDHDADEIFTSWGKETAHKYSREDLDSALEKLDSCAYGMILRAKGIVDGGDTWYEFDMVPGEHEIRACGPDVTGKLCVIGSDLKEHEIAALFHV